MLSPSFPATSTFASTTASSTPSLNISYAYLPLYSFAHACEGRCLQAGTPEIIIASSARSCGIGRRGGLPWARLIPRVGMLTTTGPLGTAQARQPTGGSSGQTAFGRVLQNWNYM
uniref:Uncharacterized protein n=1 Tax=Ananas comosus var. bracteatus TaxID=296719 RepID=A0A6V7Q9J3_ANACO|nr:unnamed protein product [Ananas comosus var. bracteatus]